MYFLALTPYMQATLQKSKVEVFYWIKVNGNNLTACLAINFFQQWGNVA